jgi:hypothetical protein
MIDTPIEVFIPVPVPVPVLNDDLIVEVERLRVDLAQRTAERNEAQKALASLQEKLLEFINDKEWLDRTFHEKEWRAKRA